jgi:hypothetical protein
MASREDGYFLWYYPRESVTTEQLATYEGQDWEGEPIVTYKSSDIGTKEAIQSFDELYRLLKERVWDMDKVLDEIIGTEERTDLGAILKGKMQEKPDSGS